MGSIVRMSNAAIAFPVASPLDLTAAPANDSDPVAAWLAFDAERAIVRTYRGLLDGELHHVVEVERSGEVVFARALNARRYDAANALSLGVEHARARGLRVELRDA